MFVNATIQSNITQLNGGSFTSIFGFGMMSSSINYSYYVTDFAANKVYILNDNWSFVSFKTFTNPAYMITVENSLYMTGESNIWKLNENLNTLIQYNDTTVPGYRGLYFNSTNRLLYVAPNSISAEIHVFDLNLTLNHRFSISSYIPWSITGYNNQLYIGTSSGTVILVQKEVIVNQFKGCGDVNRILTSMLFDEDGYFATSCNDGSSFLIFVNGTFTGKSITTPIYFKYFGSDSKDHFILISDYQITIYK